jgi:hypothetical protein
MKIFYRISGNEHGEKHPSKIYCLENFLSFFDKKDIRLIADNCSSDLFQKIQKYNLDTTFTNKGNSQSFLYCVEKALKLDEDFYYFVEDDYLHDQNCKEALLEGISIGDYATLYDHPDKYSCLYDYGEIGKIFRFKFHWKTTISTTMTFAVKKQTLQEDFEIWKLSTTFGEIPQDHYAFCLLRQNFKRSLVCPIPGLAYHMDFISINNNKWHIDNWVKENHSEIFKENFKIN